MIRSLLRMLPLLLLVLAPSVLSAQTSSARARHAAMEARRDSLEKEILQKFVTRLASDLRLDDTQRAQVERALAESGQRRHDLLRQSGELRGRMFRALRTGSTADEEFVRLLAQSQELRDREHALWDTDMQTLSRIFTPRQRVHFLLSWAYFQDSMRDILARQMREGASQSDRR